MESTINSAIETSDNNTFLSQLKKKKKKLEENIEEGIKEQEEKKKKKEKGENKNADISLKRINIQALNFIYSFREFITQEEMYFAFTSNKTQETTYVSTKTLFQQQYVDIRDGFFQLQSNVYEIGSKLEFDQIEQKGTKVALQSFKNKIIQLGTTENTYKNENGPWKRDVKDPNNPIDVGNHKAYQKSTADILVYVAFFATKKGSYQRGYFYKADKSKYYNRGWLNEWSTSYYNNPGAPNDRENYTIESNLNNLVSIKFLIDRYSRDSERGSIIGDLQVQKEGKRIQIQEKTTANKHIISLKQTKDTLKEIIILLKKFQESLLKENIQANKEKKDWQPVIKKLYHSTNETYKEAIDELFKGVNNLEEVKIDNL